MSAQSAYDEVPTLKEELDRKTFMTLEWLFSGVEKGMITEQEFSVAIDAVFMAVSGLINEDYLEIFTTADQECKGVKRTQRRHFKAPTGDKIITLSWTPGESKIVVTERVGGMAVSGKVSNYDDLAQTARLFRNAGSSFEGKGWIEL